MKPLVQTRRDRISAKIAVTGILFSLLLSMRRESLLAQSSAQLAIGPLALNFGNIQVGSSYQAEFAIQHIVGAPAASGTVTIDNPAFTIVSGQTFSLSGSDSDVVKVLFTPSAVTSYAGNAKVVTSATFTGPNSVTLAGTGTQPPPTAGAIMVKVLLDGVPWDGRIDYALTGPQNIVGDSDPASFQDRMAGLYVLTVGAGGPPQAHFVNVTPVNAQTLSGGSTITFTINYTTLPTLTPAIGATVDNYALSFGTQRTFLYILQHTDSLVSPNWVNVEQALGTGGGVTFPAPISTSSPNGAYRVLIQNPNGFLSFPFKNLSPYTADISAVFDHSSPNDCPDGIVTAFTGETGNSGFGHSLWSHGGESSSCAQATLYGFPKAPIAMQAKFIVTGHYTGGPITGADGVNAPFYLYYDGHTGIDFPAPAGTPLYASADGTAEVMPDQTISGLYEVVITHASGYASYYLHLASVSVTNGQSVTEGQTQIGVTSGTADFHFTEKKNGVRVDPFGWTGSPGADPSPVDGVPGHDNVTLWRAIH